MKITILNGNPDAGNSKFDDYLRELSEELESSKHTVTVMTLREMDIKYCTGCWGCWVKTPGQCVIKDDSHDVCAEYIHSNLVVFASPLIMGFMSSLLKKANDKLLPLVHPYIEIVQNECHHMARYVKYPQIGLLIEKEEDTGDEDLKIVSDIYARDALNLKSRLCFTRLTSDLVEDVVDEINSI